MFERRSLEHTFLLFGIANAANSAWLFTPCISNAVAYVEPSVGVSVIHGMNIAIFILG